MVRSPLKFPSLLFYLRQKIKIKKNKNKNAYIKNTQKGSENRQIEISLLWQKLETCTFVFCCYLTNKLYVNYRTHHTAVLRSQVHHVEMFQSPVSLIYYINWNVLKICRCITSVDIAYIYTNTPIYITFKTLVITHHLCQTSPLILQVTLWKEKYTSPHCMGYREKSIAASLPLVIFVPLNK